MITRVSTHNPVERAIAQLQAHAALLSELQDQISSGIRLSRPSIDPSAYVEVRSAHERTDRLHAYQTAVSDMTSTLNEGVSALQEVNRIITRAYEIASEGSNSSTDAEGHAALAMEVDGLIEQLVGAVNSKSQDRYLFSGTATSTASFEVTLRDLSGRPVQITYQGGDERARGQIGPGQTIDTFYVGAQVFAQPGADVFQAMMGLRDELRDPNMSYAAKSQALSQRLGQLQIAREKVLETMGEQSAGLDAMEVINDRYGTLKLGLAERSSELESTDIAWAVVHLKELENLYQATLGATAKLFDVSFLDFVQ